MIVVDTSAVVAVMMREAEADAVREALMKASARAMAAACRAASRAFGLATPWVFLAPPPPSL